MFGTYYHLLENCIQASRLEFLIVCTCLHNESSSLVFDSQLSTGWWFGTFFLFSHILGIIIPIDFHIFQRGGPTTNQYLFVSKMDDLDGVIAAISTSRILICNMFVFFFVFRVYA